MKKSIKITILALVLVLILAPVLAYGLLYAITPARYNILIAGSDQRGEERARSDVLMVFSLPKNPQGKTSLITIPRDSRVDIPGHGLDKITHAYVYGEREGEDNVILGNIDLTKDTVEKFLNIKIHGTMEFNFESFKEIIDMVGGVWTEEGFYDGDKALAQVRNRYRAGGDFARTEDQREIVKAVMSKLKNKDKAIEVYNYLKESEKADIKINKTKALVFGGVTFIRRFGKLSLGDIQTEFIPGEGGYEYSDKFGQNLYFWIVDEQGKEALVEEYLR